jgi:hypothetical protein
MDKTCTEYKEVRCAYKILAMKNSKVEIYGK